MGSAEVTRYREDMAGRVSTQNKKRAKAFPTCATAVHQEQEGKEPNATTWRARLTAADPERFSMFLSWRIACADHALLIDIIRKDREITGDET